MRLHHLQHSAIILNAAPQQEDPLGGRTRSWRSGRDTYIPQPDQLVDVYCWCGASLRRVPAVDVRAGLTATCLVKAKRCAQVRDAFLGVAPLPPVPAPRVARPYARCVGRCTGPECDRAAVSHTLCHTHYGQQYRGRPLTPIRPRIFERRSAA